MLLSFGCFSSVALAVEEFPTSQSLTPLYVFGTNGGSVANHQFSGNAFNFNISFQDPLFLISGHSYLFCELVTIFGSPSSAPQGLSGSPFLASNVSSQLPGGSSSISGSSTQFRASYSASSSVYLFSILTHFNPTQDIRIPVPSFVTACDREAVFPSAVTGTVYAYLIDVTGNDDGAAAIVAAIQSQTTTLNNQLVTQGNSTRSQISNSAKNISDMLVTQGNSTRQTLQTEGKAIRDKIDEVFNNSENPNITNTVNSGVTQVTDKLSSINVATQISDNLFSGLQSAGASAQLQFPGVKVPIEGTVYEVIPAQIVDLGVLDEQFPSLMTAVRSINTFICCAAVLHFAHSMVYKFLGAPSPQVEDDASLGAGTRRYPIGEYIRK